MFANDNYKTIKYSLNVVDSAQRRKGSKIAIPENKDARLPNCFRISTRIYNQLWLAILSFHGDRRLPRR